MSSNGITALAWLVVSGMPSLLAGQDEMHCRDAHRHLVETAGMTAVIEADTIDDWRTATVVRGCRITAAGVTRRTLQDEARHFFDQLRDAGWTRTPEPRDAPNEASLRFRMQGSDCLFNFYSGGLLGTLTEGTVDEAEVPGPGQRRYNFLVQCIAAGEAAPRNGT